MKNAEMISWLIVTLVASFAGLIVMLVLLLMFLNPKTRNDTVVPEAENNNNLHHEISSLNREGSKKKNYYVFGSQKEKVEPFFSWADHPCLVIDAVENGWSRFSFTSSPNVEIGWEVCEGSADYMQKIRLITSVNSSTGTPSVIHTALPLPGPRFGNSSFPEEAYFEVTILAGDEEVKNESILVCVGLTGGHFPLKIPGCFPGSIGFNSTGSVYLDGRQIVFESEKDEWGRAGNIIGCGYNPGQKKVLFTLNSQLVHEIHCKTEEFGYPLYPTLAAANTDIMILVNLGQSPFKFEPANLQRTPNPCFIRPLHANSPAILYEDSKELFSIERINSKWRQWSNNNTVNSITSLEIDHESESELFEIVLR